MNVQQCSQQLIRQKMLMYLLDFRILKQVCQICRHEFADDVYIQIVVAFHHIENLHYVCVALELKQDCYLTINFLCIPGVAKTVYHTLDCVLLLTRLISFSEPNQTWESGYYYN